MGKPNILLITTDTQRCDTLSCMGSAFAKSPHIDQLAKEGVLFKQAHTSSPVCSPARVSLLTGLHPPVHGIIENGIQSWTRQNYELFPDKLKEQGYTNIMVGKTHFGPIPASFDVQHIIQGGKDKEKDDFYADFIRKQGYKRASQQPNVIPEELCMDAYIVDTTIKEIEQFTKDKNGPFFAFCSIISPHEPLDPPGKWRTLYDETDFPDIQFEPGEISRLPAHLKRLLKIEGKEKEIESWFQSSEGRKQIELERKLYYGLAAYCDQQIGRLIQYLDRAGLRENTLVIFTSDHGTQLYDHGFADKHNYYDASWRIPLIMSMPGTIPTNESRDFAIWNDITASILGAAGVQSQYVQGFDLFSALLDNKPSPRSCAVGTLYKSTAIATKKWKLEYYFEEGTGRLFDRYHDPFENNDLFHHPKYKDIKNELLAALLTWRSDLCDVQHLVESTSGGGRVARNIAPHSKAMKGTDAERRLNEWAIRIDAMLEN